MRNMLLLGTAALALSLTAVGAYASSTDSFNAPNIYAPSFQAQAPKAVLGASVGVDNSTIQYRTHSTRN